MIKNKSVKTSKSYSFSFGACLPAGRRWVGSRLPYE
jgi:hypothetical protein